MSGSRFPHLQRRNGIFHLRMRVPHDVRLRVGLREVRRSLATYSPRHAQTLAAIYVARLKGAFEMIKQVNWGKDDCLSFVWSCFNDAMLETEEHGGFVPRSSEPDLEVAEQRGMSEERISELRSQISYRKFDGSVQHWTQSACEDRGIALWSLPASRRLDLFEGVTRVLVEQQRLFLLRLEDRLKPFETADPLFLEAPTKSSGKAGLMAQPPSTAIGPTLSEAVTAYLMQHEKIWIRKTHSARTWQLRYLLEFLGAGRPVAAITSHDVRAYRDAILCLRKNHGRSPAQSFSAKQTENVTARIANKTASLIFEPCKAFFRWMKSAEGMIPVNPAEDVRIVAEKKPKAQKSRRPFRKEELELLFSAPIFRGCKSVHRRYEPGAKIIHDAKFWVPILAYYSGCRLGECVQLHIGDVRLNGPIPFISINENNHGVGSHQPKKHVKSAAAVREVPLHPDVMALGFGEFVAKRSKFKKQTDRLFPEFAYGSDGQASTVISKFFARFMDTLGLTDPNICFHSFRHGAEDAFREAMLPQYVIDKLMGHSDGATSAGYGEGVSLETAYSAVQAMKLRVRLPKLWGS